MTTGNRNQNSITDLVDIRPIGIDELSVVRDLHASSFRSLGGAIYTELEVEAFVRQVYSTAYTDRLHSVSCFGAWFDGQLTGTSSWSATGIEKSTARIADVFVSPLYSKLGLGRMLVGYAENSARDAGFTSFTLRVGYHAATLFAELGYMLTSQGVYQLADDVPLAVAFMRKSAGPDDLS